MTSDTLSASDIANFLACQHLTNLDRAEAAGEIRRPFFPDPGLALLQKLGLKHEQLPVSPSTAHNRDQCLRKTALLRENPALGGCSRGCSLRRCGQETASLPTDTGGLVVEQPSYHFLYDLRVNRLGQVGLSAYTESFRLSLWIGIG